MSQRIEVRIAIEIAGSVLPAEILQDPNDSRLEGRRGSIDPGPHNFRMNRPDLGG